MRLDPSDFAKLQAVFTVKRDFPSYWIEYRKVVRKFMEVNKEIDNENNLRKRS